MRVLLVTHGFLPLAHGGTETYAAAHARALVRQGDAVLVLTREADASRPDYSVRRTEQGRVQVVWVNNTFREVRRFDESYIHARIADVAMPLVWDFAPEVAHIHHLTCLSTLIPARLADRGVPCFMTLHDYWLLCHRGQLLDRDLSACSGHQVGCGRCVEPAADHPVVAEGAALLRRVQPHLPTAATSLLRSVGTHLAGAVSADTGGVASARERLVHMREATRSVARFFAPSHALIERFVAEGFERERLEYSPLGFDAAPSDRLSRDETGLGDQHRTPPLTVDPSGAACRRQAQDGLDAVATGVTQLRSETTVPLRVGFIGSLMVSKAPHVLLEAAARMPAGSVTVDVFGAHASYHGDDSYQQRLAPLLAAPYVTAHGPLPHNRILSALASLDVLVVPSMWPENSPLVVQEARLAGVAVVASEIGGLPELVHHGEDGLLFPPGDVDALRTILEQIAADRTALARLRRRDWHVRSIDDDVASLRAQYRAAIAETPLTRHRLEVHALVLNYHTPFATRRAVESLLASDSPITNVMVIDNSSDVECGRALRDFSDRVEYISNPSNLGFAGGMNVGIRRALARGATHVLLVNSDVVVRPDTVGRLLDALVARPTAGIAGPVVCTGSDSRRIDSAGLSYNAATGRMTMRLHGVRVEAAPQRLEQVDAVSGCAMLIQRRVLDAVGLFDEPFFFGFEDLDFCLRARRAGFESIVCDATVHHDGGGSLPSASPDRVYYAARNHLRLADAHAPHTSRVRAFWRRCFVVGMTAAYAVRSAPWQTVSRLQAVARGVRDYRRGRFGPAR